VKDKFTRPFQLLKIKEQSISQRPSQVETGQATAGKSSAARGSSHSQSSPTGEWEHSKTQQFKSRLLLKHHLNKSRHPNK